MSFVENDHNGLIYMTSSVIPARHAFTTRCGGVSAGYLESLNLGENRGDDPENVMENYRRLGEATGIDTSAMAFSRQVHGNHVQVVSDSDRRKVYTPFLYEADGLVTNQKGLPLIVFTADCVPVLLCDGENGVIGAVHCGWRSTVSDILEAAVKKMVLLGAEREKICAAIGPAIGKCCFETGPEVAQAVNGLLGSEDHGLCPPEQGVPGKYMVDLRGVCRQRLLQLGLKEDSIDISAECTMCQHEKYWSHRATKGLRGSQASLIVLE